MRLDINHFFHSEGDDKLTSKLNEILTLLNQQGVIMASFEDFVAKQAEFNASLQTALGDIGADIQSLNDKIGELVTAQGNLTTEQQAALDALVTEGGLLTDKASALNELTPPALPPA